MLLCSGVSKGELQMKITIAVSAKNGMPYLESCLESILNGNKGEPVEILYEDACSDDGSIECAKKILGEKPVHVEKDNGCGDGINRAFRRSSGDIFASIGSDDMLEPDSLKYVSEAFRKNPDARWAVGFYEIMDDQGRPIRRMHTLYKNFALRHFSFPWLLIENIIPNVSFFIRRDFRDEVGDFINEKECLANDYDYFIRCARLAPPMIIPHVIGRWRYHRASQSGRNMKRMSMDAWKVCRRHTSNPVFLLLNAMCGVRNAFLYNKISI